MTFLTNYLKCTLTPIVCEICVIIRGTLFCSLQFCGISVSRMEMNFREKKVDTQQHYISLIFENALS